MTEDNGKRIQAVEEQLRILQNSLNFKNRDDEFRRKLSDYDVLTILGNWTINPASVPTDSIGTFQELIGELAYMVKLITGEANWYTAPDDNINDIAVDITAINGNHTIDPTLVPSDNIGTYIQLLGRIAHMVKAIAGETNWYDTPDDNINDMVIDIGNRMIKYQGALPAAGSSYRGQIHTVEGAAGVADISYICLKDAADAYHWYTLFTVL